MCVPTRRIILKGVLFIFFFGFFKLASFNAHQILHYGRVLGICTVITNRYRYIMPGSAFERYGPQRLSRLLSFLRKLIIRLRMRVLLTRINSLELMWKFYRTFFGGVNIIQKNKTIRVSVVIFFSLWNGAKKLPFRSALLASVLHKISLLRIYLLLGTCIVGSEQKGNNFGSCKLVTYNFYREVDR